MFCCPSRIASMILPLDHKIDMVATVDIGLTVADALINPPSVPHRDRTFPPKISRRPSRRLSAVRLPRSKCRRSLGWIN